MMMQEAASLLQSVKPIEVAEVGIGYLKGEVKRHGNDICEETDIVGMSCWFG